MANVNFKKGLLAALPATYSAGTFYVTTDERAMYLDISDSARIRLGDFQEFANKAALEANPNPSTTALYYITDINVLAKYDGSKYVQINTDTGMTSVEVVGEGNAVTAAVYTEDGRKLTLTKGATYMTAADVDGKISTAVGALGNDAEGNAYANVKAYVDAKTSGIATDAALSELQGRVATAEEEIDALQEASHTHTFVESELNLIKAGDVAKWNAEIGSAAAIAAMKDGESIDSFADVEAALAGKQATGDYATKSEAQGYANAKDEAIAAAKKAGDDAQGAVDILAGKVGEVPADKTVVQMISDAQTAATYDDTALANRVTVVEGDVATIKGDYLKAVDKNELLAADESMDGRIEVLEGQITGLSGAMHFRGVKAELPTDMTGYESGDVIVVGEKEYVYNEGAFVLFGDVSAEGERIGALEGRADAIEGRMDTAEGEIDALQGVAAGLDAKFAAKVDGTAFEEFKTANTKAIADAQAAAEKKATDLNGAMDTRVQALEAIDHTHGNAVVLDGITAEKVAAWDAAEKNAKDHADGLNTAMNTRVEALEAVDHSHTNAAVLNGITAEKVTAWDGAQAAAEATAATALSGAKTELQNAIDTKANSADVYAKTETYTKTEVDTAITNAALVWGEF